MYGQTAIQHNATSDEIPGQADRYRSPEGDAPRRLSPQQRQLARDMWRLLSEEPYPESSESDSDTGVAEDSDYDSGVDEDPGIGRGPSPLSSSVSSQCRPEDRAVLRMRERD